MHNPLKHRIAHYELYFENRLTFYVFGDNAVHSTQKVSVLCRFYCQLRECRCETDVFLSQRRRKELVDFLYLGENLA